MLLKNLEFKTQKGQKVKVLEIPVLFEKDPLFLKVNVKLNQLIDEININVCPKKIYSFREYLKKTLKWPEYVKLYMAEELKNNA